jgi:hypothetical protein
MAERDIPQYQITTNGTSTNLGDTSYPMVEADLTQDFGMQRVARGLDTINLNVYYQDANGNYIEPENQLVNIAIYDAFLNLIIYDTETRIASGQYSYAYTPPASAGIGIYKVVHSATVGGSASDIQDFFKIVSTNPGSYYGKLLRGEDSISATLSSEALSIADAGIPIRVKIKSPTGVIISEGIAASGVYTYSPGYNDSEGDYQIVFYLTVNGSEQIEKQYFSVVARREENLVTVEEFTNSMEALRYKAKIKNFTPEQIDSLLADAQAIAEQYVEYPIGPKLISGEKCGVSTDYRGFLYLRPIAKNITKLIRCILRFHPSVSITLPVSGFIIDNNTGIIKYIYAGGQIIPGSIKGILNEYSFDNWYEAIIDYEVGFVRDEAIRLKKAIRLLAVDMLNQGYGLYELKEVKSGNYAEQYYDPLRMGGISPLQREAFRILEYFKRAPII